MICGVLLYQFRLLIVWISISLSTSLFLSSIYWSELQKALLVPETYCLNSPGFIFINLASWVKFTSGIKLYQMKNGFQSKIVWYSISSIQSIADFFFILLKFIYYFLKVCFNLFVTIPSGKTSVRRTWDHVMINHSQTADMVVLSTTNLLYSATGFLNPCNFVRFIGGRTIFCYIVTLRISYSR